jgi:hypothetical protein
MRGVLLFAAAGLGCMLSALSAFAHHSFAAEFDAKKPITLTGTVTKFELANPHARIYLDVRDPSGTVVPWELEMGSVNVLMRGGWTRNTVKVGDTITVDGYLAKDGSHLANLRVITLSDGRKLTGGSSYGTAYAEGGKR